MTRLRQRMIDAMRMRGFSQRTHETYLKAVMGLAAHYHRCPSTLSPSEITAYFEYLVLERGLSGSSCRVSYYGIRFLYLEVLGREASSLEVTLPKKRQQIPELLTRREIEEVLRWCSKHKHRTLLLTCYGCGLRVSELVGLRVRDIDGERKQLRVRQGKGGKDRAVLLGEGLLAALREYWRLYRPVGWLFPGPRPDVALSIGSAQRAYTSAKRQAGIEKVGGIHSLRHAYATHQLESGLPVTLLQRMLGHRSIHSTLRYVHWLVWTAGELSRCGRPPQ